MKALKVIVILLVVLVLVAAVGLFALNRYIQSAAFQQTVRDAARSALHTDFDIREMQVSLWHGVTLKGIAIANPQGYPGNLLTADSFVLHYRLLPLLSKRLEIVECSLDKPVVTLARNDRGEWNYEKLGGAPAKAGAAPAKPGAAPAAPAGTSSPLDVTLSKLALTDGQITMVAATGKPLVTIEHLKFNSSVDMTGGKLKGDGKAKMATLSAADSLFIRPLAAPVKMTSDEIKLAPLSGKCADGTIAGDLTLKLTGGFKYQMDLKVDGADVTKLLQEAHAKPVMSGRLQLTANLEGTGGLDTMVGNGKADIADMRLVKNTVLDVLGTVLQMPELRDLKFQECRLEFFIASNVMQTPVIRLVAPHVQITGQGSVSLEDYSLNHELTLALAQDLFNRVPDQVRNVFADRGDGYRTLSFRVWGPYDSPKTDLQERLLKGAAEKAITEGLQKLLK